MHSFTLIKNPLVIPQVVRARRHGIIYPLRAYNAAKKVGLDFALACAMLMRETGGGQNIFGHDVDSHGPCPGYGWGTVTKAKYLKFKQMRLNTGRSNGAGSCQLTSPKLQDDADKIKGCWDVYSNMIVGFHYMHDLIKVHGSMQAGITAYNGSGPQAVAYGVAVMASRKNWQKILDGKAGSLA